jgi:hypothetical protein
LFPTKGDNVETLLMIVFVTGFCATPVWMFAATYGQKVLAHVSAAAFCTSAVMLLIGGAIHRSGML